jgi:predicted methyltransferase
MQRKTDIADITHKEIYSEEEKRLILQRLNEERLRAQQSSQQVKVKEKKRHFTEADKRKILEKLNENRLAQQRYAKIREERTKDREIYKFSAKEYYKLLGMQRAYYLPIEVCEIIDNRPKIITLFYQTLDALQKKDVLMKTENFSKGFFISEDVLRVYYKSYELEKKRK